MIKTLGIIICFLLPAPALFAEIAADEIVQKVDEVRNPQLDYTVSVVVTSFKPNRPETNASYEVMVKGREKTIIKTTFPAAEHGRMLLMRDRDLWGFFPEVSKPLRLSLQERLVGEVSNGDIARANFSGDYSAKLIRMDNIENKECYCLELDAKSEDVTYGKIMLWVQRDNFWPLKAEFYAISGHFLKTCTYENFRTLGNSVRPTRLVMEDAVIKGRKSIVEYDNMRIGELPEKYFTKDYMKKFTD